jgi:hypothetical protein
MFPSFGMPPKTFPMAPVGKFCGAKEDGGRSILIHDERMTAIWRVDADNTSEERSPLPTLLCGLYEPAALPPHMSTKTTASRQFMDRNEGLDDCKPSMHPLRMRQSQQQVGKFSTIYGHPGPDMGSVIVLDWDDTLYPTSWLQTVLGSATSRKLDQLEGDTAVLMRRLENAVLPFLIAAVTHSVQVYIVTLARRPWVEDSSAAHMPDVWHFIERAGIQVVYAREYEQDISSNSIFANDATGKIEILQDIRNERLVLLKSLAMTSVLARHNWTQLLCVGDSDCEMLAAQNVSLVAMKGQLVKTLKLFKWPSIQGLCKQLEVVTDGYHVVLALASRFHMEIGYLLAGPPSPSSIAEYVDMVESRMRIEHTALRGENW